MIMCWYSILESSSCCRRRLSDSRKLRFRDDSAILVILESPGTNEVLLNRVATGATGSNLCVLLEFLRQKFRSLLNNEVPPKFLDRFHEEDFCYEKDSSGRRSGHDAVPRYHQDGGRL